MPPGPSGGTAGSRGARAGRWRTSEPLRRRPPRPGRRPAHHPTHPWDRGIHPCPLRSRDRPRNDRPRSPPPRPHAPSGTVPGTSSSTLGTFRHVSSRCRRCDRRVEVHSANGYLLHQFLAPNTNRRTDAYGGGIEGRIRFTIEVVDAVAVAVAIGADRTGLRISPGNTVNGITDSDADDLYPTLLEAIAGKNLAYLHIAYADPAQPLFTRLRETWPGTLIANPVLPAEIPVDGGKEAAEHLLAAGADLIALGRPFLANPDLAARMRTGAPVNAVRAKYAMYTGGSTGYTDYPALGALV
ncbi:hypothetical protein [Streptomyces sp. NPDC060027]|uniref:oxidoreductase n=1 Tax=Streptomyces sp. NPDC060027 TaxID=3347040 RepID=UPI0036A68469